MESTELAPRTLADRCPYSRDFGPNFRTCVAYTQEEFTGLDTRYRPLRPVLTCRHLAIGSDAAGAYYPRCAIGKLEDRAAWAREVGPERLRGLRELSVEYRTWVAGLMPQVWDRKGRVLAARAERGDVEEAEAELRASVDELLRAAHAWIDSRAGRLAALGLDPAILKDLVTTATHEWVESAQAALGRQVPEQVLQQFPPEIQVFIRAGR
jgi:hypothetical protein